MDPNNLIFIDETGANLNMTLLYGRAPKGDRIKMPAPMNRGMQISIIGAISTTKVEAALYGEWATNGDIFQTFITTQLIPNLSPEKVVLLDNVQFHKSDAVIKAIETTGARVIFLPPYSPEFNPIEPMWSKLKHVLEFLEPRTFNEFKKAIKKAFSEVTESDLIGWYNHCGYSIN